MTEGGLKNEIENYLLENAPTPDDIVGLAEILESIMASHRVMRLQVLRASNVVPATTL